MSCVSCSPFLPSIMHPVTIRKSMTHHAVRNFLSVSLINQFAIFFIVPELTETIALFIVIFPYPEWVAEIIFRVIEICNPSFTSDSSICIKIFDYILLKFTIAKVASATMPKIFCRLFITLMFHFISIHFFHKHDTVFLMNGQRPTKHVSFC